MGPTCWSGCPRTETGRLSSYRTASTRTSNLDIDKGLAIKGGAPDSTVRNADALFPDPQGLVIEAGATVRWP
jgi:hypothetical protein